MAARPLTMGVAMTLIWLAPQAATLLAYLRTRLAGDARLQADSAHANIAQI